MKESQLPSIRTLVVCGGHVVYGAEKVTLRWIRGLKQRCYDISCTVSGWNDGRFIAALEEIDVPYEEVKLGWLYVSRPRWTLDSIVHYPGAFRDYARIRRSFAPQLVLHCGYRTAALLCWMTKVRHVVAVHDYWTVPRRVMQALDQRITGYVAVSNDIVRHLESLGIKREKIIRIYNAADFPPTSPFDPSKPRPVTFGIAGQVIPRKGHAIVINAMTLLRNELPSADFRLRVYGDGPEDYLQFLKTEAVRLGVAGMITWCGYRGGPRDYFPEVDCALVVTTNADPCPLAAIEPSAFGLPTIATNVGGLAELIVDGETGFQVPPNDAAALANRMRTLIENTPLRRQMGEAAFRIGKQRFEDPLIMDELDLALRRFAG